ncbi:transcriptional regulator [Sanguibacter keddieii DSM 10542]|uniref:Transcriptional regulator n=1 Tax=Sanguibacter keddieii (strain ATCC 51767 / DSM 10542 / NCFB 3025 / ST-74) TaxID=446469 RepID=D1BJH1_SANKS|nr:LysR family transcriptional regulator [Sanguibacter keddieii]ACZ20227.1 transcriptional regulator [Sanguibacter keddieii DSM 10542]
MSADPVAALLPHLRLLVALGEVEHVTIAAAMLGVPQPTVSRTVRRLEQQIGAPLLEPDGRGVRLTPAARTLVPYAQRALDVLTDGLAAVETEGQRARTTVRIAFQTSLGEQLVPELIRTVRADDPTVRFVLSQGARSSCLDSLLEREADIALVSRLDPPPDGVRVVPLFEQELVLLVPEGHPAALAGGAAVVDLASEPLVTLKTGYGLRGSVDELFAEAGVLPSIAFEGEDLHTLTGLVAAGLGVAVAPRTTATPAGCVQVPLADARASRDIGAAVLPAPSSEVVVRVLDALRSLTGPGQADAGVDPGP